MKENGNRYLYVIFAVIGFIFLRSGWGKVSGGEFVGTLGATLGKFASKNPNPIVTDFLNNVAIPNSQIFGFLTMWGEVLTGLNLLVLSAYLLFTKSAKKNVFMLMSLGFAVGFMLNLTFWFAAGWTSASTDSVNLVMGAVNAVGLIYALKHTMIK